MTAKNLGKIFILLIIPVWIFADIKFTQEVSKDNIYLNETIKVTLKLTVPVNDNIDQVYFEEYDTYEFWIKPHKEKTVTQNKDFKTFIYEFLLEPKEEGIYTLPKQLIKISSEKIRKRKRWLKIKSNANIIKAAPLFNDLPIQGAYTIDLKADKPKIKANESVNLVLTVKGKGNLRDIKKFTLGLKDQIVYGDRPNIAVEFKNDSYQGELTQKFLVIADKSFTVPSLKLEYYNPFLKKVRTSVTKPLFIEVEAIKKEQDDHYAVKYIFAFTGMIMGILLYRGLIILNKKYKRSKLPLVKLVKNAKNDKQLYNILIQNSKTYNFDQYIQKLEENIYKNKKHKIVKWDIINLI